MDSDQGERQAPRFPKETPVTVIGRRDSTSRFSGLAVGLSENGFGMRSRDEALGKVSIFGLLRQPVVCRFEIPGVALGEIVGRVIRVEPSRRDLRYLYFLAVEFLEISVKDQVALRGVIESFEMHAHAVPYPGVAD